jgi:hypothetical protein
MLAERTFKEVDSDGNNWVSHQELIDAMQKQSLPEEFVNLLSNKLKKVSATSSPKVTTLEDFKATFQELPRLRGERLHFVKSIGLDVMLAKLLKKGSAFDGLRGLKNMTEQECEHHIQEVIRKFVPILSDSLRTALNKLHSSGAKSEHSNTNQHINSKFVLDGAFVGRFATLDDFYKGPESLIGIPNPVIATGMKSEHCHRSNANTFFTADNYNVTTTPRIEWDFVQCEPKRGFEYPHTPKDKTKWRAGNQWLGRCGREPEDLKLLLEKPEAKRAALKKEEVTALRLYTGPMFVLYNAVLRSFPKILVDVLDGNGYETTIFTIASGIIKLSKVTGIPKDRRLYRGVGGMILPRQFWEDFEECRVTFTVTLEGEATSGDDLKSSLECIVNDLKTFCLPGTSLNGGEVGTFSGRDVSSTFPSDDLGVLASYARQNTEASVIVDARVVSEARLSEEGVTMSVAVGMSKSTFLEKFKRRFKDAVKACIKNEKKIIIKFDFADKPKDFRGGGMFLFENSFLFKFILSLF